jgi:hypothetical protein
LQRALVLSVGLTSVMRCSLAQWLGQFSGHTHESKVEDLEETLRLAVKAFHIADPTDRVSKAKSIRGLAERLLSARLKLLKVRISELDHLLQNKEQNIHRLRCRHTELNSNGVKGILAEYSALDALV